MTGDPGASRRRYTRVGPALHADMVRLKARGRTHEEIAERTGASKQNVGRVLRRPATQAEIGNLAKRLGVDKQGLRERAKEILAQRLTQTAEKACDVLDEKLEAREAKDASFAMQVIERLDKVSGNTVGEGQRIIHEGLPQQSPQVELKTLIAQILPALEESDRRIAAQKANTRG